MCLALEYVVTGGNALLNRVYGNEDTQLLTTRGTSVFRNKRRNSKKKVTLEIFLYNLFSKFCSLNTDEKSVLNVY
jgi:hypothetical protein